MKKMIRRDRKLGIKALSLAAIAGLTLFGLQAQADTQTTSPFGRGADVNEQSKLYIGGEGLNRNGTVTGAASEITPTLGDDSAYTISEGTAENYNFTAQDSAGNTTYYKINILMDKFSTVDSITWEEVDETSTENTVKVDLPNNETKYYKYTYTMPDDYTKTTTRVTNINSENVNKKLFDGIRGAAYGVALNVSNKDCADIDINSDFTNNYGSYHSGAGIEITNSKVGNINGSFINNSVAYLIAAGLYVISGSEVNSVNGDFVDNHIAPTNSSGKGAGIANSARISSITGNFIVNWINSSGASNGAAINNDGVINTISSNFVGNRSSGPHHASYGGAINNYNGTITEINGDFIANSSYSHSGAIFNGNKVINSIKGDFIANNSALGGAINNGASGNAVINNITGMFISNYATGNNFYSTAYGGALNNNGTIGTIDSYFLSNHVEGLDSAGKGGAISNNKIINNINADFSNNYVIYKTAGYGGAISNNATINTIIGNFTNNYVQGIYAEDNNSNYMTGYGGAIYNSGKMGEVIGDFIGNKAIGSLEAEQQNSQGGALYNTGSYLSNINGNFQNNSAEGYNARGGAIYNSSGYIKFDSDFTNNYVKSSNTASGGAIHNYGFISNTKDALYSANYVESVNKESQGGAVYNNGGGLGVSNDTFKDNYASSKSGDTQGGAIYNSGKINVENTEFSKNHVQSQSGNSQGGALYNVGTFASNADEPKQYLYISKSILVNENTGETLTVYYNYVDRIQELLSNGYKLEISQSEYTQTVDDATWERYQGYLANGSYITENPVDVAGVTEDDLYVQHAGKLSNSIFKGNYAQSASGNAQGGAVYNSGNMNFIENTEFKNNLVQSETGNAEGGAMYNNGNFILNANEPREYISIYKIIITNSDTGETLTLYQAGGDLSELQQVIDSGKKIEIFTDTQTQTVDTATWAMANEYIAQGLLTTENPLDTIDLSKANIYTPEYGGIVNSSLTNNYAKSINGTAHGGAIYTSKDLQLIAKDGYTFKVSGNYVEDKDGKRPEGIYVAGEDFGIDVYQNYIGYNQETDEYRYQEEFYEYAPQPTILTLNATDNAKFVIDDQIVGSAIETKEFKKLKYPYKEQYDPNTDKYIYKYLNENGEETDNPEYVTKTANNVKSKLVIKGDSTGKVYLNNDVKNLDIEHNDVTTYVNGMKYLNQPEALNSLTMNSGTLNIGSLALAPLHFDTFSMNGGTINIDSVDVDLANKTMGRITANNYNESKGGTVNVKAMNILSDAKDLITPVKFADKSFKSTVKTDVKEAYTPLYKYDVEYDTNRQYSQEDDDGYFIFKRYKKVTPQPKPQPQPQPQPDKPEYNPAVLATPVATQAAGQATIHQTFQYVFEHADAFMQLPSIDRFAKIHDNEYALSTDYNNNLGELDVSKMNKGVWVRPYTSFDRTDLKNGPKVDSVNYGTIIGADTEFRKLRNGWSNVGTGYIGYFGSQIDFSDVDTSMNGGLLGLTETFYKGNFFTALTASVGAGVAESHTMYGKDDITMLMAGIASKTGYNFEFKEGKFIIQPILMVDYTMINTFDYTNAAGVKIDADPMHTIQINPTVRFIGNLKDGWQPYASVGMVWNLMNETSVSANGVDLPSMHTKPYVEYGAGLQRTWDDKFTAFGQAMVRNGGRTGIAFTAGFRWALGDEPKARSVDASPIQRKESVKKTNSKKRMSLRASQKLDCFAAEPSAPRNDMQKTVVKSRKTAPKSRNLARYQALIAK